MSRIVLQGRGASPGIAIGKICHLPPPLPIPHYRLSPKEIAIERNRLHQAMRETQEQWQRLLERRSHFQESGSSQILHSHLMMLKDPLFLEWCEQFIRKEKINAEWAVERTGQQLEVAFAATDEATTFKRQEDVQAVVSSLLQSLSNLEPFYWIRQAKVKNHILVTEFLSPEAVVFLKRLNVIGFVTQTGGRDSHSMILARSLCIPAISGIEQVKDLLPNQSKVILNGFEGKLLVSPDLSEVRFHQGLLKKHRLLEKLLLQQAAGPAKSKDNKRIRVEANVELPEEIPQALKQGAEGIGLFRTESLFWNRTQPPSEKTQKKIYQKVIREMKGHPITFRTLDTCGETWLGLNPLNPALGMRGIRFTLKEEPLLKTQLRAWLKASAAKKGTAPHRLLIPMVTSLEEIEKVKLILAKIRGQIKLKQKIALGMMIEVPAAGLLTDLFAKQVDFFAIGSNDLIQYTLAMDRTNEQIAGSYSAYHPAVLKLLFQIVQNAQKRRKPIYLCGELGGDPLFLPVLLGLGIKHFSMNSLAIPRAKKIIRSLSIKECRRWLKRLLKLSHAAAIEKELKRVAFKLDRPWWAG